MTLRMSTFSSVRRAGARAEHERLEPEEKGVEENLPSAAPDGRCRGRIAAEPRRPCRSPRATPTTPARKRKSGAPMPPTSTAQPYTRPRSIGRAASRSRTCAPAIMMSDGDAAQPVEVRATSGRCWTSPPLEDSLSRRPVRRVQSRAGLAIGQRRGARVMRVTTSSVMSSRSEFHTEQYLVARELDARSTCASTDGAVDGELEPNGGEAVWLRLRALAGEADAQPFNRLSCLGQDVHQIHAHARRRGGRQQFHGRETRPCCPRR